MIAGIAKCVFLPQISQISADGQTALLFVSFAVFNLRKSAKSAGGNNANGSKEI